MKLIEAIRAVAASVSRGGEEKQFLLATGTTPLHLGTFLHAHLQAAIPTYGVRLSTGSFGDLVGNIARAVEGGFQALAVVAEWSDLDPRLGLRVCGGWTPDLLQDILSEVESKLARVREAVVKATAVCPVAVSLPTLPLPPVGLQPGWQAGDFELQLSARLVVTASQLASVPRVSVLNRARLDLRSPLHDRLDVRSELAFGFPYRNGHADVLASMLASLLHSTPPKKGIITDLDDTLWSGILGEVGVLCVCWDLSSHAQIHGLYQQMLRALAESGILIGVASKNEPELVHEALGRSDLLIGRDHLFPVEASWGAKSTAVGQILKKWNIGANAVVFIDDSPLELEEVRAAHPGIECILFPKDNAQDVWELLWTLRDRFGKDAVREEDRLRMGSLRQAETFRESTVNSTTTPDELLANAAAKVSLHISRDWNDERALELVNKTNQFNLNGIRYERPEWQSALSCPDSFLMTVSYEDKFGPLGKIGVVMGRTGRTTASFVRIEQWVLSCRAFSRRIEYQTLHSLFEHFNTDTVELEFRSTDRNSALRGFLQHLLPDLPAGETLILHRSCFEAAAPALFHKVTRTSELAATPSLIEESTS